MTLDDLRDAQKMLADAGPQRNILAVTAGPGDNEIGCTIENKAQGNSTLGYFHDDDDDEAQLLLIMWLLNHADELLSMAQENLQGKK